MTEKYYGKYRGTVINNVDPEFRGRLLVSVTGPGNPYLPSSWAMPCLPVGGMQMGIYAVPPPLAGVWIEFEQGDINKPIWTGCFYGTAAEVPLLSFLSPPPIPSITLQTVLQNGVIISDDPLIGITIKCRSGASITVNDLGILIQNGKGAVISMISGPLIDMNATALQVV
jgi:hypothetical protein